MKDRTWKGKESLKTLKSCNIHRVLKLYKNRIFLQILRMKYKTAQLINTNECFSHKYEVDKKRKHVLLSTCENIEKHHLINLKLIFHSFLITFHTFFCMFLCFYFDGKEQIDISYNLYLLLFTQGLDKSHCYFDNRSK